MKISKIAVKALCLVLLTSLADVEAQQSQRRAARKVDEYAYGVGSGVRVQNDCDVDAHLDNFAHQLRTEPDTRGYLIFYRGLRTPPKYFAYDPHWQYAELRFEWKFDARRVVLVDGGYRAEAMMEIWIAPAGAESTKSSPTVLPKKRRKR